MPKIRVYVPKPSLTLPKTLKTLNIHILRPFFPKMCLVHIANYTKHCMLQKVDEIYPHLHPIILSPIRGGPIGGIKNRLKTDSLKKTQKTPIPKNPLYPKKPKSQNRPKTGTPQKGLKTPIP
jgi:hypothetical protein